MTSSLIHPSYTIRATISEKVFLPEKFHKTEYFPTKRMQVKFLTAYKYVPLSKFKIGPN